METITYTADLKQRAELKPRVSNKYAFVDTDLLVERVLQHAPTAEIKYRHTVSRKAWTTKHIMEVRLHGTPCSEGFPTIFIENSYNGESSLVVRIGLYRLACSNGLILGKDFFVQRVRHNKGQKIEQFLEDFEKILIEAITKIVTHFDQAIEILKAKELTYTKQREIIEALKLPALTKEMAIDMRTRIRRKEDEGNNAWTLLNSINEAIRIRSRSGLADYNKNTTLLEEVMRLAA